MMDVMSAKVIDFPLPCFTVSPRNFAWQASTPNTNLLPLSPPLPPSSSSVCEMQKPIDPNTEARKASVDSMANPRRSPPFTLTRRSTTESTAARVSCPPNLYKPWDFTPSMCAAKSASGRGASCVGMLLVMCASMSLAPFLPFNEEN